MDVKDLNKAQLILLTILISFIVSIATGITAVSLMQQAPQSVAVPINRVVQQTIEKIVPGSTKTETVVVKEEDLVVDAIAKNKTALFSVSKMGYDSLGGYSEIPAGFGFAISSDGTVVADATMVPGGETYFLKNDSGKFKADFVSTENGFSLLKAGDPVNSTDKLSYTVPAFGNIADMKAGQKIISLGNEVSSFLYDGNPDISLASAKSNAGGMLIDLDGNVLGMVSADSQSNFIPIDKISAALNSAPATP